MAEYEKKLKEISERIKKGTAPPRVTVREFLSWFGAYRRGAFIVQKIRKTLEDYDLQTHPDFDQPYIDSHISIIRSTDAPRVDPTYRIGRLESANRPPVSVPPTVRVEEAVSVMLMRDFSQMPVMTSEREVKGVISWKSIGSRLTMNQECVSVKSCMDPAEIIPSDMPLFNAVERIAKTEYVLVQDVDKTITGIVTASDLSGQFRQLAEPFMLLGEIENFIRRILRGKFTNEELQRARDSSDTARTAESITDLTFGEYVRLLENPRHWNKLKLNIDRSLFIKQLDKVRIIRNGVMHFDPDGIEQQEVDTLREFTAFMQQLANIGVV